MKKIFIDGSAGTTGLKIVSRLSVRSDIQLITLPEEYRKDTSARADALNSADIAFLCLPDSAAIEAVSLVTNENTAIIDTSTAHRVDDTWAYGFAELKGYRHKIQNSKRIANPGCHASGFVALVRPLVENGIIPTDLALTSHSLTGYSGGGKKMIADYTSPMRSQLLDSPAQYAVSQNHKHLKEMVKICGITTTPIFTPIVAPYYSGMEVTVPLFAKDINTKIRDIEDVYREYYQDGLVHFVPNHDNSAFLYANSMSGRDDMQLTVCGNDDRILLIARFDNLGKGASGAAIQNMNILMGIHESTGLVL
ncbi:MAG: N-acetyl-gamma-glutamyl-phosphate reductase [Clostridia bacterium]|nr:N-acetyl-gamma-glutamyl-phosphate reductase [Clostridia bacterium]